MIGRDVMLLAVTLALATTGVRAQETTATITGHVADSVGARVRDATVSIGRGQPRTRSDSAGRFRLAGLKGGQYVVTARRVGFHSASVKVTVRAGETRDVSLRLGVLPVPLDTVVSEARATSENLRLSGFTARQRMGFGYFLTRDDIERFRAFDLWDVLRRVPFLTIVDRPGGHQLWTQDGTCRPRVYVDGAFTPVLDLVPVDIIDGIEVYRRAVDVPVEYAAAGRACGAVLVWTR